MDLFKATSRLERRRIRAGFEEGNSVLVEIMPKGRAVRENGSAAVAFVLDFSSSMLNTGEKQVRKAMSRLLDEVRPTDLVSLVPFHCQIESATGLVPGSEAGDLQDLVAGLKAKGSTNMGAALDRARADLATAPDGTVRHVCILTDGHPNSQPEALAAARRLVDDGVRNLQPIAYGSWNGDFLEELAGATPGVVPWYPNLGGDEFSIEERFGQIYRVARSTVLTNLRVEAKFTKDVLVKHVYAGARRDGRYLGQAQLDQDRVCALEGLPDVAKGGTRILLEVVNPPRPPGTFRVCTVKLFYDLPREGETDLSHSLGPLKVTYTAEDWDITDPDPDVRAARDEMVLPRLAREYEDARARGDKETAQGTREAIILNLRRRGLDDKAKLIEEEQENDVKLVKQVGTKTAQVQTSGGKRVAPKTILDD